MADIPKKASSGEKWQALACLVAGGAAVKDAAATLNIAERTAYRYAALPEFRRSVCSIRTTALDQAVGALNALTTKAIRRLDELLDGPDALGAIKTILANATKLAETVEFRERLDRLERGE